MAKWEIEIGTRYLPWVETCALVVSQPQIYALPTGLEGVRLQILGYVPDFEGRNQVAQHGDKDWAEVFKTQVEVMTLQSFFKTPSYIIKEEKLV